MFPVLVFQGFRGSRVQGMLARARFVVLNTFEDKWWFEHNFREGVAQDVPGLSVHPSSLMKRRGLAGASQVVWNPPNARCRQRLEH